MFARLMCVVLVVSAVTLGAQHHDGGPAAAPTPQQPATLSLDVAVDGGRAYAVTASDDGTTQVLLHRTSTDGGATWSAPVAIEPSRGRLSGASRGTDPQIAAAGGRLVVLWMAKGTSSRGNGLMEGARSDDGGRTWAAIGRPSDVAAAVSQAFIDVTADPRGAFHAVWLDSRDGGQGLRTTISKDGGRTWRDSGTIDARTCECCWNTVVPAGNGALLVLYRDKDPRDMAMARSTDGGTTWQRTGPVGAFAWGFDGCPHVGGALAVGADATTVHALVWTGHDTKRGAYALTSTDTGATWKAPVRVGPDDAWHVDLVRDGARLIATWDVNRPGDSHIGWASSADGGATWQEGGRLSGPGVRASHPKLVAAAGRVTAVWTERPAGGVLRWQQAAIPASTPSTIRR